MTAGSGVRAIGQAAAEAAIERAAAEAEQLELVPSRLKAGGAALAKQAARVERHKAGRPAGARNLATRQTVDFVRRVFGDPMVESARWLLHTPESLAVELRCTKGEAFDRLEKIRADLRRFMYAPLAPTDGDGNAVAPVFALSIGGAVQGADGRAPWSYLDPPETQQNRALPAPPETVSHEPVSHGDDK